VFVGPVCAAFVAEVDCAVDDVEPDVPGLGVVVAAEGGDEDPGRQLVDPADAVPGIGVGIDGPAPAIEAHVVTPVEGRFHCLVGGHCLTGDVLRVAGGFPPQGQGAVHRLGDLVVGEDGLRWVGRAGTSRGVRHGGASWMPGVGDQVGCVRARSL
jgi:hypothetical protein